MDINNAVENSTQILIGNRVRELTGTMEIADDVDWFQVRTRKSTVFSFTLSCENPNVKAELYDADLIRIPTGDTEIVELLKDNDYYVKVFCDEADSFSTVQYTVTFEGLVEQWCFKKRLYAGDNHNLVLKGDGTVWAWGQNNYGQLGDGTTANRHEQVQVPGLTQVKEIAATSRSSYALKSDGTVWVWGLNTNGQLGLGNTINQLSPVQIPELADVVQISCGSQHCLALKKDGSVWAWGYNANGVVGDGTANNYKTTPTQVTGLPRIAQVFAGENWSMALTTDGDLWAWGLNNYGNFGNNATSTTAQKTPLLIASLSGFSRFVAGQANSIIAQKDDGKMYVWGLNNNAQLGIGHANNLRTPTPAPLLDKFEDIMTTQSATHCFAVREDGSLWAWGNGIYGKLGEPTVSSAMIPMEISALSSVAEATAGQSHSLALKQDGTLWAWGSNSNYQLGIESPTSSNTPILLDLTVGNADDYPDSHEDAAIVDIEEGGNTLFLGAIDSKEDTDWFAVRTQAEGDISIKMVSGNPEVAMNIYDEDLTLVSTTLQSIVPAVVDGIYYIQVIYNQEAAYQRADYSIQAKHIPVPEVDEYPDDFESATPVVLPMDTLSEFAGKIINDDDKDCLIFQMTEKAFVFVDLVCANPNITCSLFNSSMTPVETTDTGIEMEKDSLLYVMLSGKRVQKAVPYILQVLPSTPEEPPIIDPDSVFITKEDCMLLVQLTASNVPDLGADKPLMVRFDSEKLKFISVLLTPGSGSIDEEDYEIIQSNGAVEILFTKDIPEGFEWSGLVALFTFELLGQGEPTVQLIQG